MTVRIHGWNRLTNHYSAVLFSAGLTIMMSLAGCTTPGAETKKMKAAREEPIPPVKEAAAQEQESKPQKQESLAAVEEFLARTQEYRLTPQIEPNADSPAKPNAPQIEPVRPTKSPDVVPQAAHPAPPKDAAFANAQISIGDSAPPSPQAVPAVESVTIRTPAIKASPATPGQPSNVANGPVELGSAQRNDAAEALVNSLRNELKTKADPEVEWKLRALLLALGRDAEAATFEDGGPVELKGILPAWTAASTEIRNLARSRGQDVEGALDRVNTLRNLLTERAQPRVQNVAMCRKVLTYGSYEEMAAEDFVSGRSVQTIVYAEIENLRTVADSNGIYETRLATRLEVLTADGKSMWQREEPDVVDRCRHPRRDFFVAQRVTLPPTLPVGEYVMKFHVEDKASGLMAESQAAFSSRSPVSVAKGQ